MNNQTIEHSQTSQYRTLRLLSIGAILLIFLICTGSSSRGQISSQQASEVDSGAGLYDPYGWFLGFGYPGISGQVYKAETVGNDLYIGGWFDAAGGVSINGLAKLDGQTGVWSGFGLGASSQVYDVLVYNNQIFVAGRIELSYLFYGVAVWDGSVWTALGGEINGVVYDIAIHQGQLFATGTFTAIGDRQLNRIARWSGSQWEALGSGLDGIGGPIEGITLLSVENRLYVGGDFDWAGGVGGSPNLALWQDGQWAGITYIEGSVSALAWDGASLYVGGRFFVPNQPWTNGIVRIQNGQVYSMAGGLNPGAFVRTILLADGRVYFAGGNILAGLYTDGTSSGLNNVGYFDGSRWHPMGAGLGMPDGAAPDVTSLRLWQGKMIAAGFFTRSGSTVLMGLAFWNGVEWQRPPLSSGISGGVNGPITDMYVVGSQLYVAGGFSVAGDQDVAGLVRWDGERWQGIGDGTLGGLQSAKYIIVIGNDVYVAGYYRQDAEWNDVWNVAHWNGSQWRLLGELTGRLAGLFSSDGIIYAYGRFRPFSPDDQRGVARWDGQQWVYYTATPFYSSDVEKAEVVNGMLYACGQVYDTAFGEFTMVRWVNDHWERLFDQWVEPSCDWRKFQGKLYLTARFKEPGEYFPIVVETAFVEINGSVWRKLVGNETWWGYPYAISENGDFFYMGATLLRPQFVNPDSIYSTYANMQWGVSQHEEGRPVPNSEFVQVASYTSVTSYGDMLIFGGMETNLYGWSPPAADVALFLDAPNEVQLGHALPVTGTFALENGQAAGYVGGTIIGTANVQSLENHSPGPCDSAPVLACYLRTLLPNKAEAFHFAVEPQHLGRLFVEMKNEWTGRDINSSNDRASVGVNVYDTLEATPAGGRFPFWFSGEKLVDFTLPPAALPTNVELRIEGGALPPPGDGLTVIEPVFGLRSNNTHRGNDLHFALPISTTVRYSEVDSQRVAESTLALMRYDSQSGQWIPSHLDCTDAPVSAPSPDRNRVYTSICQSGIFALVGEARPTLFLPQLARSGE